MNLSLSLGLLLSVALVSPTFADEALVKKGIESLFPKAKVDSVAKTNYGGLYEVYVDGSLIYTDEKFSFFFNENGHLIDTKLKKDITAERLEVLTRIDFNTLPLDKAIKVVKGNGARKMVVFSDPDCPFCKRLEQRELTSIDNVTIYTFLFPLENLHPNAAAKSKAIWCAPDKAKAWTDWVMNNKLPEAEGTCETPLAKVAEVAQKSSVTSTPTIFFSDGRRIQGAYPAAELEKALKAAEAVKK